MSEIWKDIVGFEGFYQVSNTGKVKSLGRYVERTSGRYFVKEKILTNRADYHGYHTVTLKKNKVGCFAFVHRLVAKAFIANPLNKPVVNHIDNSPKNNNVENLEWATLQENQQHSHSQGRAKRTAIWIARLKKSLEKYETPIMGTNIATGERLYFKSIAHAGREGFQKPSICMCCKGRRERHKGYKWQYVPKNSYVGKMLSLMDEEEERTYRLRVRRVGN
jgi:hypothetical protein